MILLALIVAISPVLVFKGLTLETLWSFFNVHPFLFTLLILDVVRFDLRVFRKDDNVFFK